MIDRPYEIRVAENSDVDAVADVFSRSVRELTFLPFLHTVAEDHAFIADTIFRECAVTVADDGGRVIGFLARDGAEIRLLYVDPEFFGRGAGSLLLDHAKTAAPALELWCFQANTRARRFYERRGFTAVAFTDGARNEENTPDVRYRWRC